MRKFIKYTLTIFAVIFAFIVISGNYFYDITINRKTLINYLEGKPYLDNTVYLSVDGKNGAIGDEDIAQLIIAEKAKPESVTISSYDDLSLSAIIYEQQEHSDEWIIAVHGYKGYGMQMISPALIFFNEGYNVLIPDCRGHGNSDGDYIGMGWHDRIDLMSWINEIIRMNSKAQIVIYGVSMGGATVLMATGEELPVNVKAAISDCSFTTAYDQFSFQAKSLLGVSDFPLVKATSLICSLSAGYSLDDASAVRQVRKSKTPTLFIHGSEDDFIPVDMTYKLYEAAECEKEILIIDGSKHGDSYSFDPENYWSKVFGFLDKNLTR